MATPLSRASSLREYAAAASARASPSVRRSRTAPASPERATVAVDDDDEDDHDTASDFAPRSHGSAADCDHDGVGDDAKSHGRSGFMSDSNADGDKSSWGTTATASHTAAMTNDDTINSEGSDCGDEIDACNITGALDTTNDDWCKYGSLKDIPPPQSMHNKKKTDGTTDVFSDDESAAPSEAKSEASMMVLMRYMGLTSKKYMEKPKPKVPDVAFTHDLHEGDHVIRWKMLGYCYPIQVHGIVYSVGPDFVTIVDFSLGSYSDVDKAGASVDDRKKDPKKTRRRMNILTLADEKEIKKWSKIRYGEEVELKVHSTNEEMQQNVNEEDLMNESADAKQHADIEQSPSAGLELEEVEKCVEAKIKTTPEKRSPKSPKKSPSSSWFWGSCQSPDNAIEAEEASPKPAPKPPSPSKQKSQKLRLPKADPPGLVLARLRFLLEYGEQPWPPPGNTDADVNGKEKEARPNLLPPPHLLYANSECIAVFCKTGRWSTLQASIFLHSSTVGNAKQTATVALYLSAQTVTVPASGFWGFFGGTTTISLFTAQPWLVPALVGGGMVYVGLPTFMLWKAKGRWGETERRLNAAFWSIYDANAKVLAY